MYVCIHRLRCHGIMHLNDDPKSNDDAKFQIITLHLILNPMYVRTYVHSGQSDDTVITWCHHTQHLECHRMGSRVHCQSVGHWIDVQHPWGRAWASSRCREHAATVVIESAKPHGTRAPWSTHEYTCKYNWIDAKWEQNWYASVPSEQSKTCLLIVCHCVLYSVVLILANSFVNSPPQRKSLRRDVYCLPCSHGVLGREYTWIVTRDL